MSLERVFLPSLGEARVPPFFFANPWCCEQAAQRSKAGRGKVYSGKEEKAIFLAMHSLSLD
jgi:hypothetical protein